MPTVVQPLPFSKGETEVQEATVIDAAQPDGKVAMLEGPDLPDSSPSRASPGQAEAMTSRIARSGVGRLTTVSRMRMAQSSQLAAPEETIITSL